MYIRVKSSKLSPRKSVQIVQSVRTGKRVSQVILQHVGIAHDEKQLSELRELGRKLILEMEEGRQPSLPGFSLVADEGAWERPVGDGERVGLRAMKNLEQVTEGPAEVVERLFTSLGFEEIFGVSSRGKGHTNVLKQCLACALANPSSKRGMSRWLEDEGGTDMSLNRIYRMMDALAKKTDLVREIVARETVSLFETKATLLLFDVTTLYFESFEADGLRVPGYSKDNRIQETQVVLALAVTPEGFPLWYELFPGNTFEGHTLVPVLRSCMGTYSPLRTVVVADRAMFTEENLRAVERAGCSFIVGAKLRSLGRAMRDKILDAGNYAPLPGGSPLFPEGKNERGEGEGETDRPSLWFSVPLGNGRTLLVTWSARRARKDASDRERLLARLRKKLEGKEILPGKSLITNRGTNKYLSLANKNGQDHYILDEEKVLLDSRWDGLHGVVTDMPAGSVAEVREILAHYGSLWRIEESFRVNKHDLSIRPVYHWVPRRIEAHIALTYLAFVLLRHLQHRVAVRQNAVMSAGAIRAALLDVQSTLMKDEETGKLYRFPKVMNETARKIYRSLGLVRGVGNTEILSVRKYRNRKGIRSVGGDGDETTEEGTGRN